MNNSHIFNKVVNFLISFFQLLFFLNESFNSDANFIKLKVNVSLPISLFENSILFVCLCCPIYGTYLEFEGHGWTFPTVFFTSCLTSVKVTIIAYICQRYFMYAGFVCLKALALELCKHFS